MSHDAHEHPSPPPGEPDYWLDQPANINLLVKILIAACVIVVGADFFYHKHGHFGFQEWFAFDAVFGFAAYVGLVNAAKLLRKIIMRDETYYDRPADRLADEPTGDAQVDQHD
tara:strand:- start:356 stop:694 length:339 start_codon:yes stop_codon:yes gene_type:complete